MKTNQWATKHWHMHVSTADYHKSFFANSLDKLFQELQNGNYPEANLHRIVIQEPISCEVESGLRESHHKSWINLDGESDEESPAGNDGN